MAHAAAHPLSSSTSSICNKSVQFSRFIKISFTYPGDEYDRTALEPAKLSFSEATELMQLRIDLKQELNKRMQQQAQQEQQQLLASSEQDSEDGFSSDESTLCGSSSSSPRGSVASKSSRGCLRLSPSLKFSSKGCGGSSSGSSSGPSSPIDCNNGGSLSDDEDSEYNQARAKSLGNGGMMHRHSEFHQPTENMPCLA
ncbi:hypothetical protein BGZ96_008318 [Linnemannia gamsii]|uniref:Uncharacterized protein n=1 Tax=Linnemannia gamsii TaxID=64522 RepID=A0ABQ7K0R8_9FUNG|nr:hypothetical protein BGZ96_008318 [Linnemannia gamsii]